MMWTLLKDAVDFCRRHWWFLIVLVLPLQLVLVFLLELSGIEVFFADYMQQVSQEQAGAEASVEPVPLMETLSASSSFMFLFYLVCSVYPTALVISYVRCVFAGEESTLSKVHSASLPLWVSMIGLYCLTWGAIVIVGMVFIFLLSLVGLAQSSATSLFMTGYIGLCIYLHHRLSLAPYFCAQRRIRLVDALKLSWQYAQPVVLVLMFGNFLVYVAVVVLLSGVGNILQSIVPEVVYPGVEIGISVFASLAGVLQVVFIYRVFAFVTQKADEVDQTKS